MTCLGFHRGRSNRTVSCACAKAAAFVSSRAVVANKWAILFRPAQICNVMVGHARLCCKDVRNIDLRRPTKDRVLLLSVLLLLLLLRLTLLLLECCTCRTLATGKR